MNATAQSLIALGYVLDANGSTWVSRSLLASCASAGARITPTDHEKSEWSRFAVACYASGRNAAGHRFSSLAALPSGFSISPAEFYSAQDVYRAWLVFGEFPKLEGGAVA